MPRIDADLKLDFKDVLLRPKRSSLKSRAEVDLERTFTFRNSKQTYSGIPIIVANMDTVGTFEMAVVMSQHSMFTAIHKHYTLDDWKLFAANHPECLQHVAVSSGSGKNDLEKMSSILEAVPQVKFICLDVANGYSEHFVEFVKLVRAKFPEHTIMAGNVVTGEMVEELILSGADIIKVGVGPGRRLYVSRRCRQSLWSRSRFCHAGRDVFRPHGVRRRGDREERAEAQALLRDELRDRDEETLRRGRRVQHLSPLKSSGPSPVCWAGSGAAAIPRQPDALPVSLRGQDRGSTLQRGRGEHDSGYSRGTEVYLHLRRGRQTQRAQPEGDLHPGDPAAQHRVQLTSGTRRPRAGGSVPVHACFPTSVLRCRQRFPLILMAEGHPLRSCHLEPAGLPWVQGPRSRALTGSAVRAQLPGIPNLIVKTNTWRRFLFSFFFFFFLFFFFLKKTVSLEYNAIKTCLRAEFAFVGSRFSGALGVFCRLLILGS
uniref:GMP reductase n=1 Tax=Sus scrofa TaxID=9823 RepID=A0A8W4FN51_PIG